MSTLLLALPAGLCRASEPVTLELLPAAEIGPQVIHAKGPDGQPAVEVTGGPQQSMISLIAADTPELASSDFVLRGKMKAEGITTDIAKTALWLRSDLVTDTGSKSETNFAGVSDGDWYEFKIHSLHNGPQQAVAKVKRIQLDLSISGDCKVTLDRSLVLAPMVKSGDQWEAQGPIQTLQLIGPESMAPRVATVHGPGGEATTAIQLAAGGKISIYTLAVSELPRISSSDYVLRGRVKYNNHVPGSYLELLNDFGDQGTYFTRTLADDGPMKKLDGTSDWRDFELPFHAQPGMVPKRLTLKAFLPVNCRIAVAEPLVVVPLNQLEGWWNERQAGLIGGSLAAIVLVLGCLVGLSAAASKPLPTASLCGAGLAICVAALLVGLAAGNAGQPGHVVYPPLLIGAAGACVFGFTLRGVAHRSQIEELRRMSAADVV